MAKKKKNVVNVVYSTDENFNFNFGDEQEEETLPPQQQNLKVMHDKKQRGGKTVTLITGFIGKEEDLKDLGIKAEREAPLETFYRRRDEALRKAKRS